MRRHWIAGAVLAGTAVLALTSASLGSAASGTHGTEHFSLMSTNVGADKFSVIATGAFTAGGTATPLAGTDTLSFPNGTIDLASSNKGKPRYFADTKTCYESLVQKGTYTVLDGTGAYKGIAGSGRFTLTIRQIGPFRNGKCDTKTTKRVASQGIITARGPVTLR